MEAMISYAYTSLQRVHIDARALHNKPCFSLLWFRWRTAKAGCHL